MDLLKSGGDSLGSPKPCPYPAGNSPLPDWAWLPGDFAEREAYPI